MDKNLDRGFRLRDIAIYPLEGTIVRPDQSVHLQPKAMEVLLCLAEHPREVVDREFILQQVWGHSAMTDDVLTRCISELRHHLEDDRQNPRFIQTIPKRGYRLLVRAAAIEESDPERSSEPADVPNQHENGALSTSPDNLSALLGGLKRRRVVRVAAVYAVVGGILMQVAEAALPALRLPDWTLTFVVVLIILGFPLALVFAYALDPAAYSNYSDASAVEIAARDRKIDLVIVTALIIAVTALSIQLLSYDTDTQLGGAGAFPANTIAVQPFENMTGDPENELLAYGLAEEIRVRLSELPELSVAASTSSRNLAPEKLGVSEIAERLGVARVLEGTLRRERNNVRVTVRLFFARTERAEWSGAYDLRFEGIFKVQDEISLAVVDALKIVLSRDSRDHLVQRPTENLEALKDYLRARQHLDEEPKTKAKLNDAKLMFESALERDPGFARAYAGLCETYLAEYGLESNVSVIAAAESACSKALELDKTLSEVHVALGLLYLAIGRATDAEHAFKAAITLNPRAADAHRGLGRVYADQNDVEGAEKMYGEAIRILPSNWKAYRDLGFLKAKQGLYEDAITNFQRVVQLSPKNARGYSNLGVAFFLLGDFDSAAENYGLSLDLSPVRGAYSNTGTMLYYAGRFAEASTMFRKAIDEAPRDYRLWEILQMRYVMFPERKKRRNRHTPEPWSSLKSS